jgi:hypothetical protein
MGRSPFVAADFTAAAEEASMVAAGAGPVAVVVGMAAAAGGLAVAGTAVVIMAVAAIGAVVAGMAAADGVGARLPRVRLLALLQLAPQPTVLATSNRTSGTAINTSRNGSGFANAFVADPNGDFLKRRLFRRLSKS